MARATLTKTSIPALTSNGLNLTDTTYTTLATGAGNGISFAYDPSDLIVLKNDTGGSAAYTIKVVQSAALTAVGVTIGDVTITVATAKSHAFRLSDIFKQSGDLAFIDCDVAGKALVIDL